MATVTDIGTLIAQSSGIRGGRPCVAGTGVSVLRIAGWYKMGRSPEEIADQYGHLTCAQVYAALAYYHANRDQIDAEMAAEEAEYDRLYQEHRAQPRQFSMSVLSRLLGLLAATKAEEMQNRLEFLNDWPDTTDG